MKSHCNTCGGDREHHILKDHSETHSEELDEYGIIDYGSTTWMLKCAGCDSLSFKIDEWHSEITDERGKPEVSSRYFPPRIFRQQPLWLKNAPLSGCPMEVSELLNEAYVCMQNSCKRAATMTIRALLERIMINEIQDQGSFIQNLAEFEKEGYLSKRQREVIEPVLEAGHASIHRGYVPSNQDLIILFDVTQTLIEFVYIHTKQVAGLKTRVPIRKKS